MRTVVVSGSGSGLGAAVVSRAAAHGWTTVGLDVRDSAADHSLRIDVSDHVAVQDAIDSLSLEQVDAVVTCAGIDYPGALAEIKPEQWERIIGVNLIGTAVVIRACLPLLPEAGGNIVTVASTLGIKAVSEATAYCASKFGVVGFTRALAAELRPRHSVTALIPGGMQTSFFNEREERFKPGPDAELADPLDVAETILTVINAPATCAIRELVVTPLAESSWP